MSALPERVPTRGGDNDRPDVARLLDIPEVAARLSLSKEWVRILIRRGDLFSVKSGRRRLVPESAVVAYIGALTDEAQS